MMSSDIRPLNAARAPSFSLGQIDSLLMRLIALYLDGVDIAALWFTGDRKIRYLMSEAQAVSQFAMKIKFKGKTPGNGFAFPRLILSFPGLKSLKFSSKSTCTPDLVDLKPIQSLESLTLKSILYCGLFRILPSNPYPNLKTLLLQSDTSINWSDPDNLKSLPSTLETLEIRTLENSSNLSLLPSSLTSVTFTTYNFCESAVECPTNLKKLVIEPDEIEDGMWEELNLAPFIASLPRTMTWFSIAGVSIIKDCFPVLPPALTRLGLENVTSPHNDSLAALANVTPHLTHLHVSFIGSAPASVVNHLSPSLKYVAVSVLKFLKGTPLVVTFPQSATFAKLPSFHGLDMPTILENITRLPSGLTDITFPVSPVPYLTEQCMKFLPKTITHMTCAVWSDQAAMNLPPKLKKLVVSISAHFPEHASQHLPTSLTEFSLRRIGIAPLQTGWVSRLTSLTKLEISLKESFLSPSDLSSFPSTLSTIWLYVPEKPKNPRYPGKDAWIAATRHLTELKHFSYLGEFSDPDILYGLGMPLRSIELEGIPTNHPLLDEHIFALNMKMLKRAALTGASICTDQSLSYLPAECISFHIPASVHFTAEGLQQLRKRDLHW
jgi:hypothetical protein